MQVMAINQKVLRGVVSSTSQNTPQSYLPNFTSTANKTKLDPERHWTFHLRTTFRVLAKKLISHLFQQCAWIIV